MMMKYRLIKIFHPYGSLEIPISLPKSHQQYKNGNKEDDPTGWYFHLCVYISGSRLLAGKYNTSWTVKDSIEPQHNIE